MTFNRGDKVVVYDGDLLQPSRLGTVVCYSGRTSKARRDYYRVRFDNNVVSVISDEWLKLYEPPVMDDTRNYLDALAELSCP